MLGARVKDRLIPYQGCICSEKPNPALRRGMGGSAAAAAPAKNIANATPSTALLHE